eukprot:2522308-Prorocentrum_lima.AAC.1
MKQHESLMKQKEEEFAIQLPEKQASVNHLNILSSNARRQEQGLIVLYKRRMNDLEQQHAAM